MDDAESLWQRSPTWRWVFSLTVLLSALCIFASPWRTVPIPSAAGQYIAQPASTLPAQQPLAAAVTPRRPIQRDAGFDRAVSVGSETFGSGTEMHVVGVYGAATSAARGGEWIQACKPVMGTPQMIDCKRQFEDAHPEDHTIKVEVERSSAPVVLVLMAYQAVNWSVSVRPGIDLRKVIVGGYSGPDIKGVPNGVPVEVYSHDASPCSNCSRQPRGFWAYDSSRPEYTDAMARLKALTGLEPTSFQGGYQGNRFTIQRWQGNKQPALKTSAADDRVGKLFSNSIDLAGKTLLLPEGVWEVLALDSVKSSRGQDQMLVLSRHDKGRLQELMVTHLELANDTQGYPAYEACTRPADYVVRQALNQPGGMQQCYWVTHTEDPWQQPIYRATAGLLKERAIGIPDSALVTGFHKATANLSVTTQYYAFVDQVPAAATVDWVDNPWNPSRIQHYAEMQKAVKERMDWASGWFMLFNAMR